MTNDRKQMAGYPSSEGRKLVLALVQVIEKNKTYLSEIDGKIGDGDHGINMAKGFPLVKTKLGEREVVVSEGLGLIGQTLLTEIGGSIGPLYGTFFLQMSLRAKDKPQIDETTFGEMLRAARAGLEELGGAKVGDKTIMDVLVPAVVAYESAAIKGASFRDALAQMADAAENGKEATRDLVAKIGRASRLGGRSRGVLDAGAASRAIILQTMATILEKAA
jgi:phosphoenolpyruvate---glycerone phosphotransferase subunit DhaL